MAIASGLDFRHALASSVMHAVSVAQVETEPFTHATLQGVFPSDLYGPMLDALPALEQFTADNPRKYSNAVRRFHTVSGGEPVVESCRYTLPLNDASVASLHAEQREVWQSVSDALHSVELKSLIFTRFADDLCRRFRMDREALLRMPAYSRPTIVRDFSGYWIVPHPDSPAKIVTVQIYLPRDASQQMLGTTFYRRRLFNPRILLSLSNLFEPVQQIPFLPNSGYMFPVGRRSWHGRPEVPAGSGERNSILLVYYRDPSRVW